MFVNIKEAFALAKRYASITVEELIAADKLYRMKRDTFNEEFYGTYAMIVLTGMGDCSTCKLCLATIQFPATMGLHVDCSKCVWASIYHDISPTPVSHRQYCHASKWMSENLSTIRYATSPHDMIEPLRRRAEMLTKAAEIAQSMDRGKWTEIPGDIIQYED